MSSLDAARRGPGRWASEHAELRRDRNETQVVVGEEPGIDRDMRNARQHREQMVGEPGLPGLQRGMARARQPLAERDHRLQPRLSRRDRERRRALDHVRVPWRAVIGAGYAAHRLEQSSWIEYVRHDRLGACRAQPRGPRVVYVHGGAHRAAELQQSRDDRRAGLAGGAGHKGSGMDRHGFVFLVSVPRGVPRRQRLFCICRYMGAAVNQGR